MKKGFAWYDSIFIIVFIYLFILQVQAIWPFTIDDMYISLRYARHWAAGDGLLWNLNAPPVEGYSNFTFVVLGAVSLLLNINPVIALKVAGLIGLFFICLFVFFISRFWFEKRVSLLPCIALLLYKGQIIWAVSGFETTVYQALICAAVYFSWKGLGYNFFPDSRKNPKPVSLLFAGICLSFAAMTRPEAPAFIALFFILLFWDKPSGTKTEYWKGVVFFVLSLGLIYLPYFIWRFNYYGFLFPNSVYCKGFTNTATLLDKAYLKLIWPFLFLAFFACIRKHDKRYYYLWLPSFVYLLMLAGADPVVAFDNRLFLVAFVLLLPLALIGISDALFLYFKQRDTTFSISLFIVSFCTAFFFIPAMTLPEYRYFTNNPLAGEQLRSNVGQWLDTYAKKGDIVVIADAGMIPYHSHLNFTDSYCLNNSRMSQYPKAQMYELFCREILGEKPQIIILTSLIEHGRVTYTPSDVCLKSLLSNQSEYKLSKIFFSESEDSMYRYELFTNF